MTRIKLHVEFEREEDGRWIAEIVDLPGVLVYGAGPEEAIRAERALAVRVLADKLEHGELDSEANRVEFLLQHSPAA